MSYKYRQITRRDSDFLEEMVYQAIFVREGEVRPSREILKEPPLQKYTENWGRHGDIGFIAIDRNGTPIGAIWTRLFNENNATFGYINDATPVLTMTILPEHRGAGTGTTLLHTLMEKLKEDDYPALSLSVDPDNPVLRLYERCGFEKVGVNGTSWDMIVRFDGG